MQDSLFFNLFRKKTFEKGGHLESELKRCLSVFDIMFIAVGHMIGAGIFVLTGSVVHNQAGPSIIISFLLAGFAALLSAFSYAEFGARYPRAGSAYTYAYVGLGEIWAFIIGWTVLLEYLIGNAAVARSWSAYFDSLLDYRIRNLTLSTIGHLSDGTGFFSDYPDILAFLLLIVVAIAVAIGSKASASVNTVFVLLNISVLIFVIGYGFTYADFDNWVGTNSEGVSKFFPFGIGGTLTGAATCFFAFIGFEALGSAGEEAKKPHRTIPMAIFGSLALVTVLYVLMAATLTLMVPFDQVHESAAFAEAFRVRGATVAQYVITIGALCGMFNNIVTGSFALPRSIYAMADDGLIFNFFAKINGRTKVPVNAIVLGTVLNGVIATIFDLKALVDFLSIGTLFAYSIVSACVLILRYQPAPINEDLNKMDDGGTLAKWVPLREFWEAQPSGYSITVAVIVMIVSDFSLALCCRAGLYTSVAGILMMICSVVLILFSFIFMLSHKQNSLQLSFKVPLIPFIPSLGLFINVFMMAYLNGLTWIRMIVWMTIGLVIYMFYGFTHSKEGKKKRIVADEPQQNNVNTTEL